MKRKLLTIAVCVMTFYTAFSQVSTNKKNTIVLVHGAWLDASSWQKITPALQQAGHEVIVVNLPGHGKDNTSFSAIQLQTYVDAVKKAIGNRTNVTLVGHSMAGLVISQTAEQIPSQIRNLIYIAAFLPRNGESLFQLATQSSNKESLLGVYQRPDEKSGAVSIAKEGLIETFAADVSKKQADDLLATQKPDPLVPFVTPVVLSDANFGKIPKTYIYTLFDKAVAFPLQQEMVANSKVTRTYSIPSSHVPFFSMPGVLSAILLEEAK